MKDINMDESNETNISSLACTLISLTAVLRAYCYCHSENNKEISKLVEFVEILDTKTNQLFDYV